MGEGNGSAQVIHQSTGQFGVIPIGTRMNRQKFA
jgi:hypothetical protein